MLRSCNQQIRRPLEWRMVTLLLLRLPPARWQTKPLPASLSIDLFVPWSDENDATTFTKPPTFLSTITFFLTSTREGAECGNCI